MAIYGSIGFSFLIKKFPFINSGKLIEGVVGLEYKVGCWAFRVVANRLLTGLDPAGEDLYATSFFVQLELKDITRIGSAAVGTLQDKVDGYSSQ